MGPAAGAVVGGAVGAVVVGKEVPTGEVTGAVPPGVEVEVAPVLLVGTVGNDAASAAPGAGAARDRAGTPSTASAASTPAAQRARACRARWLRPGRAGYPTTSGRALTNGRPSADRRRIYDRCFAQGRNRPRRPGRATR